MDSLHDGRITLHKGDCLDLMRDIPDNSIDAIITDPPFGTTACKWDSVIPFEPMWLQLKRIIKPRGAIVLFGSQPFTSALVMSNPKWFKYQWVWDKVKPNGMSYARYQPMRRYEDICIFSKGSAKYFPQMTKRDKVKKYKNYKSSDIHASLLPMKEYKERSDKFPQNIISISNASQSGKLHPTQKPAPLLEYLIRTYTNPDETVLDFTFGSCTAGVAAVNTGRKFIGIERDDHYYSVGLQRVRTAISALPPMAV